VNIFLVGIIGAVLLFVSVVTIVLKLPLKVQNWIFRHNVFSDALITLGAFVALPVVGSSTLIMVGVFGILISIFIEIMHRRVM